MPASSDKNISLLLALCRYSLFPEEYRLPSLDGIDSEAWSRILLDYSSQGVISLLPKAFEYFPEGLLPDKSVLRACYGELQASTQNYFKVLNVMRRLAETLSAQGIDILFLKGAMLSALYPDPGMRPFSDIDFYLFGEHDKGEKALNDAGVKSKKYFHHHSQSVMNGTLLENHYDFFNRKDHKSFRFLDDELKTLACSEGRCVRFYFPDGGLDNAFAASPTMNAIFLMGHMAGHFAAETISLRMLFDWTIFLRHQGSEVDWERVCDDYRKAGLDKFAGIIQYLIVEKLGVEVPQCPVIPFGGAVSERVWKSITKVRHNKTLKKYGLRYYIRESAIFVSSRWKHSIVFPDESYFILGILYLKSHLSRKS